MKNMSAYHVVSRPPTDAYREGWERVFGENHVYDIGCTTILVNGIPLKSGETVQQRLDKIDTDE